MRLFPLSLAPTPIVSLLSLALGVAGCAPFPVTLTAQGPQQAPTTGAAAHSQINSFRASWDLAYNTAPSLLAGGAAAPATVVGDAARAANNQYLNSGFSLINTNCMDYFRAEGRLQQTVNVFRDALNAFMPVATGALALESGSARAAAILALSQAAANGAINTVYMDFLFDASNIDDVQQLVTNALSAHEVGVRTNLANAPEAISYEWVTDQLLAHQAICLPAHILGLARAAIAGGTVIAFNKGTSAEQLGKPGGLPPNFLPPQVGVAVAPSSDTVPAPNLTIKAAPDAATRGLMQCLFPSATKMAADGTAVDASGNRAPADPAAVAKLQAWLARNGINDGIAVFLSNPADAALRASALREVCNR